MKVLLTCRLRKGKTRWNQLQKASHTFHYLLQTYKSKTLYVHCECCDCITFYPSAPCIFSTKDPVAGERFEHIISLITYYKQIIIILKKITQNRILCQFSWLIAYSILYAEKQSILIFNNFVSISQWLRAHFIKAKNKQKKKWCVKGELMCMVHTRIESPLSLLVWSWETRCRRGCNTWVWQTHTQSQTHKHEEQLQWGRQYRIWRVHRLRVRNYFSLVNTQEHATQWCKHNTQCLLGAAISSLQTQCQCFDKHITFCII